MPRYFFHLRGDDLLVEDPLRAWTFPPPCRSTGGRACQPELAADATGVCGLAFEVATREGRVLLKVPLDEGHRAGPALTH
jgi:hypothetical protein